MLTSPFGPTGRDVPVVGQGTWELDRADRRDAVAALRRGFELGLTHVDTAEMYGSGAAEEVVGEALEGAPDDVFVVTKVLPHNASRRGAVEACERSLRRLRRERVDLYLLHWPGSHPLEDTLAAFEELRAAGKIGAYGVSNFDADELGRAAAIAGPDRLACNQVLYHLRERAIEHAVVDANAAAGAATVAYSPFGSGDFPDGHPTLEEVAARVGATPRQVALAFLARRDDVFVIPKAARIEHVEENARAGDLVLDGAAVRAIDAAFPRGPEPASLPVI